MGQSTTMGRARPLFRIVSRNGRPEDTLDGLTLENGRVWGTYIHGVFDNDEFRRDFLGRLKQRSGKSDVRLSDSFSYRRWKEDQYDRLADHVRRYADVGRIYRLMGL